VLPLEYRAGRNVKAAAQYADYKSKKLNYVMYKYFLARAEKRVAGVKTDDVTGFGESETMQRAHGFKVVVFLLLGQHRRNSQNGRRAGPLQEFRVG